MTARETGAIGEKLAAEHYQKDGYSLATTNYRTRMGEIDLVMKKDNMLVFTEVKTRSSGVFAAPREWVDARKQRRVILAAMEYLEIYGKGDPFVRFDVVEVYFDGMKNPEINRIENAFEV